MKIPGQARDDVGRSRDTKVEARDDVGRIGETKVDARDDVGRIRAEGFTK